MLRIGGLLTAVAALGCAELGELPAGQCGNGFVEAEAGEDCDGTPGNGLVCRKPGQVGECRLDCSADPNACPATMRCGGDGICRAGSGSFDPLGAAFELESVRAIEVADVDGDGRDDVIGFAPGAVVTHYFDPALASVESRRAPSLNLLVPAMPAVGEVSGDARADVLVPTTAGFVVQLGTADRERRATAYPTISLPPEVTQVGMLGMDVLPDYLADEYLLLGTIDGVSGMVYVGVDTGVSVQQQLLTLLPAPLTESMTPVLVGRFDQATSCEELVIGYEERASLHVFAPCRPSAGGGVELNLGGVPRVLAFPTGRTGARSLALLDANDDGLADIVAGARAGSSHELVIAYGVGDGSFHSDPVVPPSAGDGKLSTLVALGTGPPLAIADVNGDRIPDWVHERGVRVSTSVGHAEKWAHEGPLWTLARIAPLNLTGSADIVVADEAGTLSFLNGATSSFTDLELGRGGLVRVLETGDFDGDQIGDIVVSRQSTPELDQLSVAFGSSSGGPTSPVDVGLLDPVQHIGVGRVGLNIVDAADDFAAVAVGANGRSGIVAVSGSSSRDLRAPMLFNVLDPELLTAEVFVPRQHAFDDLTGDGHADLAALGVSADELAKSSTPMHRLFLVPMTGIGSVDQAQVTSTETPSTEADWSNAGILLVDLDGDATSELVVVAPAPDGQTGRWSVVRTEPSEKGPKLAAPLLASTDFAFHHSPSVDEPRGLASADLDGDGSTDVVALASLAGAPVLVVLYNDAAGSLAAPVALPAPPVGPPRAFALVRFGTRRRLAVLAGDAVVLADIGSDRTATYSAPLLSASAGNRLAAGDLDADGVDDLVIAGPGSARVHRGVAHHE